MTDETSRLAEAYASALRKLRQAPKGLKPYRQVEVDEARRAMREAVRFPSLAGVGRGARAVPRCWCGGALEKTKYGPVCVTGAHDD